MAKYIVQKAVEPGKVKKKLQRSMDEYAATFLAQTKMDGCCAVVILRDDGTTEMRSRTGELVRSMKAEEQRLADELREDIDRYGGLVLIGEAWHPRLPQNVISGLFRQHDPQDELMVMAFDVLTIDEFEAGHSPVPYMERYDRLQCEAAGDNLTACFWPGTYGSVADLLAREMAIGGRDGIILRDPQGTWTAGSGTSGEIIKVKRSLSFDLRVIGGTPGTGKHEGRMGALIVDFGGKQLKVGTGFTDEFREWAIANSNEIIGKIVEVEAMDFSADGLLREPRFKGIRHDKLEPDTIAA